MAIFDHNIDFIYYSCGHQNRVPGIARHILPFHEITYCMSGHMEYYVDNKMIVLETGDVIVNRIGDVRQRNTTCIPSYYASFNIILPLEVQLPLRGKYSGCIENDTPWLLEKFREEFTSDTPFRLEKCIGLFEYIYARLLDVSLNREHPTIQATRQYIMSHLGQPLMLETIAEAVHLEPHYLCTLFKKATGMTIFTYITKQRIVQAERMIRTGSISLTEIAEKCGFKDYSYFSNTFKKITGQSPTCYRDTH